MPTTERADVADEGEADPDARLVAAWVADDHRAMREVWERYGSLVQTYCASQLINRDLVADCVQETFVSAWRSRHRFDPTRGSLAAWLLGIARHRVHDTFRSRARLQRADDAADRASPTAPDDGSGDALVRRLLVGDALRHLAERPRQVIELSFYDGLSHSEIAERLALPLGTVKSDARRALQRLRNVLEGSDREWA